MNLKKARRISAEEMSGLLPNWFIDSYQIAFRILLSNNYPDLEAIREFLVAALEDFTCSKEERKTTPIKHIKAKVEGKGVVGKLQYITVEIYLVMRSGDILQLSRSCKVQLRGKMERN